MCKRLQLYVSRLLRLDNNPLIQPLPKPAADNDPVGDDVLTLTLALTLTLTLTLALTLTLTLTRWATTSPTSRRYCARRCATGMTRCTPTTA